MDTLTFIIKIVEAAAWPVTTISLVLLLKKEIGALIPFLKKFKAGPLEAEFEREVQEIRFETNQKIPLPKEATLLSPQLRKLHQLASVNPRSAIIEAWREVIFAAENLLQRSGAVNANNGVMFPYEVKQRLEKAGLLNVEQLTLFNDLRKLRNQASHTPNFEPTSESTLGYIDLAVRLASILNETGEVRSTLDMSEYGDSQSKAV
ncbi:hypothetical protein [Undibacterium luofuense]|uniref:DUF4145 domain-containing protein n=1 Tax=Undibacterium luofuense TaxID=2828733 RepID=A0A941DM29_9BURK|nr:hypothetical protein [Undibacterium luofuense]MBR7782119.1 hypothetical protein [Undibacterium luofuense]